MHTDDPEFADLILDGRKPTREEVGALVRRYLLEPVSDEALHNLYAQYLGLLADEGRRRTEELAFRANGRRYFGQLWKERLSPHEQLPSPAELALWLAIVTPGYPRPRPYCPAALTGAWLSDSGATWNLERDGGFSTTEERIRGPRVVRWCVHLVVRKGDFRRDQLWLLGDTRHNTLHTSLLILECTSSTLRLLQSRGDFGNIEYRLSRTEAVST